MCTNPTASSVTLVWSPPSDNGGETISHYAVTGTPGDISIITTMTSITVSDLTPSTEYTFTVRANNTLGFSNSSDNTVCTTRGQGIFVIKLCLKIILACVFNQTGDA